MGRKYDFTLGLVWRSKGKGGQGSGHQAEKLLPPPGCDGELWRLPKQGSDTVRFGFENDPSGLVRIRGLAQPGSLGQS